MMVFVSGAAIAEILAGGPQAPDLTAAIETAKKVFTSSPAIYQAATILMDRHGLNAKMAMHGAESFVRLAGIKVLPATDRVFFDALVAREQQRRPGSNEPPDDNALLDEAMCQQFRVPMRLLTANGSVGL
ncbi:type II toxin-antitoxin system VapC family toxin [Xanthobacter sp. DSM 14520]|uniref:type II toxin-antitoxin system VapC family toxin n=1 Tax=Xanthobacter autotrophicus (strain ATCC BAA-1158 / Py2) TaxID=78245 RepID=UPI00372AB355